MRTPLLAVLLVGCPGPEPEPEREQGPSGLTTGTHTVGDLSASWTAYAPEGAETLGVALLLPGDTWPGSDLPGESALQQWADANGVMVLSVDAPNGGDCWWTPSKHSRAAYLVDLMAQVEADWVIDPARVHLGGWSGGAFLAFGLPFYVDWPYQGGLVGVCGADVPRTDTTEDFCGFDDLDDPALDVTNPSEVAGGWRVFVSRNSDDELVDAIDAGADYWEAAGATVERVDAGTGGHCAMDVTQHLIDGLDWVGSSR